MKIVDVPFLPWARAVYEYRQETTTKDDPHTKCFPSGGPRLFHTPYGFEFVEVPDEKRIYIVESRGNPKASSTRLALRTCSMVATRTASLSRCVLR